MAKFFGIPFALTGDKTIPPDGVQLDGSVSFSQGFGPDYQLEDTDPSYRPVPRAQMNGVFNVITEALGELQAQGAPSWTADAQPYAISAIVRHNDTVWQSLIPNNNATPVAGTSWRAIGAAASATVFGLTSYATNAETQTGTLTTKSVTPAGLASRTATTTRTGLVEIATSAETKAGTSAELAVTPLTLAELIADHFVGTISAYAGPVGNLPYRTLLCDGSAQSRATYSALFARIGVTWGAGNGSTTFNLPDGRGEVLRGLDNGRGVDPGRVLGTSQSDSFREHSHGFPENGVWLDLPGTFIVNAGGANVNMTRLAATDPAGGSETRPRNIAVNFVIHF